MRMPPINWELVFWIICGAGFLLAFWQYGQIISSYAE